MRQFNPRGRAGTMSPGRAPAPADGAAGLARGRHAALWIAAVMGWMAFGAPVAAQDAVPEAAQGTEYRVEPVEVVELKAVFGRVESYEVVAARARIGGTVLDLSVAAGSAVQTGEVLAVISDEKLALEMEAVDARAKGLEAQLDNARTEQERGQALLTRGIISQGRFDQLQTALDVAANQLEAARADRAVITQRASEGQVLAPRDGRVLSVPLTRGSVILPGETVARIATGGYFLRLALPERHAAEIAEGDSVTVGPRGMNGSASATQAEGRTGRIVKVYPELDQGRVVADVDVAGLGDFFVGERALVWLPVAHRAALVVPPEAITTRNGIDYVRIATAAGSADVAVILGAAQQTPRGAGIEILSGLAAGDRVMLP